jgi:hypothetical protein
MTPCSRRPRHYTERPLRRGIPGLLHKNPQAARRLGSRRSAADVKAHPFFKSLNLALLRSSAPPVVPPEAALHAPTGWHGVAGRAGVVRSILTFIVVIEVVNLRQCPRRRRRLSRPPIIAGGGAQGMHIGMGIELCRSACAGSPARGMTNSDFFTGDGFVEFGQEMNHEWRPCCSSKIVQSRGRDEKRGWGKLVCRKTS